jgi:hypothetical protein
MTIPVRFQQVPEKPEKPDWRDRLTPEQRASHTWRVAIIGVAGTCAIALTLAAAIRIAFG